mmetsp:Transcript_4198/g.8068  ORF Transcript_4198/g.8068 Transcript_4198/m.8068 type:complete len:268 (-) Transcript_4198:77-880(-)
MGPAPSSHHHHYPHQHAAAVVMPAGGRDHGQGAAHQEWASPSLRSYYTGDVPSATHAVAHAAPQRAHPITVPPVGYFPFVAPHRYVQPQHHLTQAYHPYLQGAPAQSLRQGETKGTQPAPGGGKAPMLFSVINKIPKDRGRPGSEVQEELGESREGAGDPSHKKRRIVKSFRCKLCNKVFDSKYGVQRHMRSHTGERPYECDVCGKRFRQSAHLAGHKRAKHKEGSAASTAATSSTSSAPSAAPAPLAVTPRNVNRPGSSSSANAPR